MTLFGKTLSEYVEFQKVLLIITVGVGLIRLILPFAGASPELATIFSINLIVLIGMVYYPIRVHTRGFGGYPQVLILLVIHLAVGGIVIAAGIVLTALTGIVTIYSAPEFGGATNHWAHAIGHLVAVPPLFGAVLWIPAAAILFVTKRVAKSAPA